MQKTEKKVMQKTGKRLCRKHLKFMNKAMKKIKKIVFLIGKEERLF